MRILHVITTINRGGAENQLLLLVKEQIQLGHEVSIFPLKGELELEHQFNEYGATVINSYVNASPISQVLALRSLSNRYTIFHAHLPRAELVAFFGARRKYLISRHNCEPFYPSHPGVISVVLSRLVQARAKRVIAISNTVHNYLISRAEVDVHKISVVNYGFDKSINYDNKSLSLEVEGEIVLGTVSRLVPQKDLQTLLRAFGEVSTGFPQMRLAIIGEGDLRGELEILAQELQISDKIQWFGRTSNPLKLISQMDIFVMTSIYEGFGLVVLEAISQGVPVIASDNDTFKELFEGQEQNLFITGNSNSLSLKILDFLPSVDRYALAKRQEKVLEKYSRQRMIQQMELVYSGVYK